MRAWKYWLLPCLRLLTLFFPECSDWVTQAAVLWVALWGGPGGKKMDVSTLETVRNWGLPSATWASLSVGLLRLRTAVWVQSFPYWGLEKTLLLVNMLTEALCETLSQNHLAKCPCVPYPQLLWDMNDSLPWDRPLCPWDFSGKKPGVGCHSILQGIFSTQESNLHLLHYRHMFYHLSHLRWKSPYLLLLFPSSLQSEALFCSLNIIHKFLTQGSLYL